MPVYRETIAEYKAEIERNVREGLQLNATAKEDSIDGSSIELFSRTYAKGIACYCRNQSPYIALIDVLPIDRIEELAEIEIPSIKVYAAEVSDEKNIDMSVRISKCGTELARAIGSVYFTSFINDTMQGNGISIEKLVVTVILYGLYIITSRESGDESIEKTVQDAMKEIAKQLVSTFKE